MDFPHIKDTKFPIIENVNVYKYQNNFDYARWNGKVSFKLLNVLWNSNYADVPYFDTEEKRDEWFDEQEGYVGTLESLFNNTPENSVKVPIPYNDAYRYNYLVVDMPMQTSAIEPINYEDSNIRVKRWFYFIEDMTQTAPSTTEFILSVDYWTTFIHTIDIPYMMLERGHAPMTKTSVNSFLSNPIMNNEYLLAEDFNYGNETIIQTSVYKPIGNGKKYVLFCAPYRYQDFGLFNSDAWSGSSTPPTYANQSNRWGYQLTVNDYEWKYGTADYSNADLPINNMVQDGLLNGCCCYAIEGSQAKLFFNDCAENCVHFLHGIKAMFILDESLFTKGQSFTFRGKTFYVAEKKINTDIFSFSKVAFGFDSKYAEITKLYTSPYSTLEITDDEGNIFSAKIENCGNIQMHEEVSLVYPYLNYNVFFSGINGDGTMGYTWKTVQDNTINKTMWASDFSKFMMNWNIPTYELYVSAENEYAANNAADIATKRAGAIKDYQNAVRYANTTCANVADSMQTNTDNVAASGATNTANVGRSGQTNTDNVGRTGQTNTDNVGRSGATNTANVGRSGQTNTDNTADAMGVLIMNTANDNSANSDITDNNNDHNQYTANQASAKLYADYAEDNSVTAAGIDATATNMMASGVANGISALGSAASSGFSIGGTASAGIGFVGAEVSSIVAAGMNIAIANAASNASLNKAINGSDYIQNVNQDLQSTNSDNTTRRNTCNMDNATNTRTMQNGNATRTQNTNNTNAAATQATDNTNIAATQSTNNTNAGATQSTNNTNAGATQSTNNANAVRTQNTETDNAEFTRDASIEAQKADLVQKQLEAMNMYKNTRLHTPHEQGKYEGDFMPDVYQRRGIRMNIRTQSKSAIAQAGDAMLRFGYALHRVWDMSSGFHYCKHFTFWKAEDIWINDGSGTANAATDAIGNILMKGVTVWRNPENIGMVGIYDNF